MSADAGRIARAARRYAAYGWHIFPLPPREKRPYPDSRGFHDATHDAETVERWWAETPDANIGLHPGPSGIVVIDLDGPEAKEGAERLGLLAAPTLACTTGRDEGGQHLYFKHPSFRVGNGRRALPSHIDVRGDAGYVLLPPSLHPSGRRYRWDGGTTEIADLPRAALEALRACQERDEPAPAATSWTPPAPVDSSLLERRIEAYLAKVGTVTEGSRNETAYRVAAMLLRDFALGEMDAWGRLVQWNAHHVVPPLHSRELRSCMASAMRHGRRAIGSGLERERPAAAQHVFSGARSVTRAPFYGALPGKSLI